MFHFHSTIVLHCERSAGDCAGHGVNLCNINILCTAFMVLGAANFSNVSSRYSQCPSLLYLGCFRFWISLSAGLSSVSIAFREPEMQRTSIHVHCIPGKVSLIVLYYVQYTEFR